VRLDAGDDKAAADVADFIERRIRALKGAPDA